MTYELSLYVRAVDDVFGMQLSVLLFQDVEDRFLAMDLKDLGLVVLVTAAAAGTTAAETIRALPTPITSPPSSMNQTAASTKTTSMVHLLVTTAEEDTLMM